MDATRKSGPKVEIVVKVTNEDGTVIEKTVETSSSEMLPAPEDFDLRTREGFLRDFDALEGYLLEARDGVTGAITAAYMEGSKKTNREP